MNTLRRVKIISNNRVTSNFIIIKKINMWPLSGKLYGLGLASFPNGRTTASPQWRFPLTGQSEALPHSAPNHHLDHTIIPANISLGAFLNATTTFLASFAPVVSSGLLQAWSNLAVLVLSSPLASRQSTTHTQGRLRCTQHLTECRFNPKP